MTPDQFAAELCERWQKSEPRPVVHTLDEIAAFIAGVKAAMATAPGNTGATDLERIADVIEPHWRGAGLKLTADWIIEQFIKLGSELECCVSASQEVSGNGAAEAHYSAWLIETDEGASINYFQMVDDDDWTFDHNKAVHFGRKQDAEKMIAYYGWTRARAVEHMWPTLPALPTTQGDGE